MKTKSEILLTNEGSIMKEQPKQKQQPKQQPKESQYKDKFEEFFNKPRISRPPSGEYELWLVAWEMVEEAFIMHYEFDESYGHGRYKVSRRFPYDANGEDALNNLLKEWGLTSLEKFYHFENEFPVKVIARYSNETGYIVGTPKLVRSLAVFTPTALVPKKEEEEEKAEEAKLKYGKVQVYRGHFYRSIYYIDERGIKKGINVICRECDKKGNLLATWCLKNSYGYGWRWNISSYAAAKRLLLNRKANPRV